MQRNLLALGLVVALAGPAIASAEDQPTVFIHGLASNSQTWDQAVSDLTPLLAIQPYQVDLDWRALYETQAAQRIGTAVDEVAHEPQAVARTVEGDGGEQPLQRLEAALQVPDRVGRQTTWRR